MVLDLVLDVFSCISMVCILQNLEIPDGYSILGNIKQKRVNLYQKWVPRLFKFGLKKGRQS